MTSEELDHTLVLTVTDDATAAHDALAAGRATSDIEAIRSRWLNQCGSCDAGLPTECTHPADDERPVIAALCDEIERLRAELDSTTDIEATGRCCCAGCVGMGPCDRDDRAQP